MKTKTFILGRTWVSWALYLAAGTLIVYSTPWIKDGFWHHLVGWLVVALLVPADPIERM